MQGRTLILLILVTAELLAFAVYAAVQPAPSPVPRETSRINTARLHAADAAEIEQHLSRLIRSDPRSLLDVGKLLVLNGYFPAAEQLFAEAVLQDPDFLEAHLWWGITLDRLGRMEDAISHFQRVAKSSATGEAARAWYFVGRNHLRLEQPEPAEAAFRRGSDYPPAKYELAKLLLRTDRAEDALDEIDRLLERFSHDHATLQLKARALLADDRPDEAATFFELADRSPSRISLDGLTQEMLQLKRTIGLQAEVTAARELARGGHFEKAAASCRRLLQGGWSSNAAHLLAATLKDARQYNEAKRSVDLLISREGRSATASMLAAQIALSQSDTQLAMTHLNSVDSQHTTARILQALAALHEEEGDTDQARKHAILATEVAGIEAFRRNELQEAVQHLRRVTELMPRRARGWFYFGETLRFLGRRIEAEESYRACLDIQPDFGRAIAGMNRLTSGD